MSCKVSIRSRKIRAPDGHLSSLILVERGESRIVLTVNHNTDLFDGTGHLDIYHDIVRGISKLDLDAITGVIFNLPTKTLEKGRSFYFDGTWWQTVSGDIMGGAWYPHDGPCPIINEAMGDLSALISPHDHSISAFFICNGLPCDEN